MGFFSSLFGKTTEENKKEEIKEDILSYTVKLDDWIRSEKLFLTGIYEKHPEVKRRAYKALLEETIKEHGGLEIAYGEELKDKGYLIDGLLQGIEFLPLNVDDEKVIGQSFEYGDFKGKASKKTFKLAKIELIKFVSIVNTEDYFRNMKDIQDAIQKKALITSIGYIDEKGRDWMTDCEIIPLRTDDKFLYCKKGKKEEKIKLKWVRFIQYEVFDEE